MQRSSTETCTQCVKIYERRERESGRKYVMLAPRRIPPNLPSGSATEIAGAVAAE